MRRGRARLAVAVAVVCAVGIVFAQAAAPGQRVRALLPDARAVAPFEVEVRTAESRRGTRHVLAFPSITENVGDGPLIIKASRPNRRRHKMKATQIIERSDGSRRRKRGAGVLRYERSPDHSHWHYVGFMVYELRHASNGQLVGPDVKTGFCLGDRHRIDDRRIRGAARKPRFLGDCGKSKPRLKRVLEGISVGWYDNYDAFLEGQYIDITGVEDGLYTLVHRSNPGERIRETDYSNNASSALIELRGGEDGSAPHAEILERCDDTPDCA